MGEKELILRIKQIDDEIKRRKKFNKLETYNKDKVHLKQLEFHKCDKRVRFVFGGNRSGKTECGAVEAVWFARGIHPYKQNRPNVFGWVVSVSYDVSRDVVQSKILSYIKPEWIVDIVMLSGRKGDPEYGIVDHIIIKNVFGGVSKIGFKSMEQGRERFQGASLDFVWFDEEPEKSVYDECIMRLLDKKGYVWCTMTPLKGLTWVHDEIYLNPTGRDDIWYTFMEWNDNPYLDKGEIERYENTLSKDELESRKFGKFKANSGLVYSEFDESIHVIEPFDVPREWYDNISIDPGLHNPLSAHFYAVDFDGVIYVIEEHFEAEKDVAYHSTRLNEIATRLNWQRDSKGRLSALIDSAADQKTLASYKSVSDLFYENGILVNTKVDKDMWSGIARVRQLFAERPRRIVIFNTCVNLIRELKTYRWGDGDRPEKADDHALDELRYYVMSKPHASVDVKREETMQARYKNRLIKKVSLGRYG